MQRTVEVEAGLKPASTSTTIHMSCRLDNRPGPLQAEHPECHRQGMKGHRDPQDIQARVPFRVGEDPSHNRHDSNQAEEQQQGSNDFQDAFHHVPPPCIQMGKPHSTVLGWAQHHSRLSRHGVEKQEKREHSGDAMERIP